MPRQSFNLLWRGISFQEVEMSVIQNARYGNLASLYPMGTVVDVVLAHKNELDENGYGQVIYTDGLGVCIREDDKPTFYPWSNVVRLVVSK
jgi:hypothetical protein